MLGYVLNLSELPVSFNKWPNQITKQLNSPKCTARATEYWFPSVPYPTFLFCFLIFKILDHNTYWDSVFIFNRMDLYIHAGTLKTQFTVCKVITDVNITPRIDALRPHGQQTVIAPAPWKSLIITKSPTLKWAASCTHAQTDPRLSPFLLIK